MKKLLLILSFAFALQLPLAAMAQPKIQPTIEEPNKQKIGMIKRQYDNTTALNNVLFFSFVPFDKLPGFA